MREPARRLVPDPRSARLWSERAESRVFLYSESVVADPPIYGERVLWRAGRAHRWIDPFRSKLAAAATLAPAMSLPKDGERWLYLGAASGTTASHVADLVGPRGTVWAIEKSPRPFRRLLEIAERFPNLLPILADARDPGSYSALVPPVDGLYLDIAQPDQVEIARANAREYLRPGGHLLLTLKAASAGRDRSPESHAAGVPAAMPEFELASRISLAPFYRAHWMFAGTSVGTETPARTEPRARALDRGSPPEGRARFKRRGPRRAARRP